MDTATLTAIILLVSEHYMLFGSFPTADQIQSQLRTVRPTPEP